MKFTILIIDDMGAEVAYVVDNRTLNQCRVFNITEITDGINYNLENPIFDYEKNKYCIFIDSSSVDPKTGDYAFAFAEKFISIYPHLKNRICVLVGKDIFEQKSKNSENGNIEDRNWVLRIQKLPHLIYTKKTSAITKHVQQVALSDGIEVQDRLAKENLPQETQEAVNALYTELKKLYDIVVWHPDLNGIAQSFPKNSECSDLLIHAIEQMQTVQQEVGHSFAQINAILQETYSAVYSYPPNQSFDTKRLNNLESVSQNLNDYITISANCIEALQNLHLLLDNPSTQNVKLKKFLEATIDPWVMYAHNEFKQIQEQITNISNSTNADDSNLSGND